MIPPNRLIGAAILLVGLAAFGVLAWGMARLAPVVLVVFGLFGAFCLVLGWRILMSKADPLPVAAEQPPGWRFSASAACSTTGVVLLILAVLLPESFYPVVLLFAGVAFLAVAHALTPCVERLEQLRKARSSLRQW